MKACTGAWCPSATHLLRLGALDARVLGESLFPVPLLRSSENQSYASIPKVEEDPGWGFPGWLVADRALTTGRVLALGLTHLPQDLVGRLWAVRYLILWKLWGVGVDSLSIHIHTYHTQSLTYTNNNHIRTAHVHDTHNLQYP